MLRLQGLPRISTEPRFHIGVIHGLYRDNGKENGNYYSILGSYRDNGKLNGNYYSIMGYALGFYSGYIGYRQSPDFEPTHTGAIAADSFSRKVSSRAQSFVLKLSAPAIVFERY